MPKKKVQLKSSSKIPKIDKILFVGTLNKYFFPYQHWYLTLKKFCNKIVTFDLRWNYFTYGKKGLNRRLLLLIKKEKPDYIFLLTSADSYYFDTLLKIREISPKTKTVIFSGDDDTGFHHSSRYLILFFDYGIISPKKYIPKYHKDGVKNVFHTVGALNADFFKPLNLEKKYDVTFIGSPRMKASERYDSVKFLKDNGIKIKVFGWGWEKYPELKDIYEGPLESDKLVEVINQSKIHLSISKDNFGKTQMVAKPFEGGACKTFVLTEYHNDYLEFFKEEKEIVTFKDKEELLKKIKYYLKHKDKREKIAEAAYQKIIKNYNLKVELIRILKKIQSQDKNFTHRELPKINKKILPLSKKDLNLNLDKLKNKLKNYDYVYFDFGNNSLKYREYLQAYSLEKTKKPISCCNYYVYNNLLGDYLYFLINYAFKLLDKKDFHTLLNINQLMVTKDYFLGNISKFRRISKGEEIDFITKSNTAFVSFPLIRIKKFKFKDYEKMKNVFEFKFLYRLYSLKQAKNPFLIVYSLALLFEVLKGKGFILKHLFSILRDKDKRLKIRSYEKQHQK